jgi:osmoprotectant transport system ATP-binding protein
MIDLKNITFSYSHQTVLRNFELSFQKGKNTVLIGPSGCGKSTILRLINGILSPQQGSVLIEAQAIKRQNIIPVRRRMGYVIQEGGLFPNMTAHENITLMARRLKWTSVKIEDRLNHLSLLTQMDINILGRYPRNLSGGQRQRVSLMRALMLDPDVLLLDEPFGALDPLIRNELQINMHDIFKKLSKTVVFVTHDLNEAAFLADRVVLLNNGTIVQSGTIKDMVKNPASEFVMQFIAAQRSHLPEVIK